MNYFRDSRLLLAQTIFSFQSIPVLAKGMDCENGQHAINTNGS